MKRNNFLDQLRRKQAERDSLETTARTDAKPASEMTDDELEAALTASRRELLDAQHAEVRRHAKEQAGVSGGVDPDRNRPLADVFRKRPNFK
jgi:hypothetical protein